MANIKKITLVSILKKKKNSKISLIRIAAHFYEIDVLKNLSLDLKKLGYEIIINLMQISKKKKRKFQKQ